MEITINDVAKAREIVSDLLDELKMEAILFEIEPLDACWELHIECAVSFGWKMIRIPVQKKELLDCQEDSNAYKNILAKLRDALSVCTHR